MNIAFGIEIGRFSLARETKSYDLFKIKEVRFYHQN
jgi:hypothetical protein